MGEKNDTNKTSETFNPKMTVESKYIVAPQKVVPTNITSNEQQMEKHSLYLIRVAMILMS